MKTCSRCGAARPLAEFHRSKSSKDGLASRCRPCKRLVTAESKARATKNVQQAPMPARIKLTREWTASDWDFIKKCRAGNPDYVVQPGGEKTCPQCKQVLPLISFSKETKRKDGLRRICRECSKLRYQPKQKETT